MAGTDRQEHWRRTKTLMFITLTLWFVFSFGVHWFSDALNGATFFGWPLGFYMAAQGSELAFVIILFWFTRAQHKIDVECGVAEEEK